MGALLLNNRSVPWVDMARRHLRPVSMLKCGCCNEEELGASFRARAVKSSGQVVVTVDGD